MDASILSLNRWSDCMFPSGSTINSTVWKLSLGPSSPIPRPLGNEATGIWRNANFTIFSSITLDLFGRQFGLFPKGLYSMSLGLVSYCGPSSAHSSLGTLPRTRAPSRGHRRCTRATPFPYRLVRIVLLATPS